LRVPQVTELFWDIRPSEDFVPVRLQQAVDKLQGDNSLRTKKKNSGLERNHRKRRPGDILISARNVQYTYLSTPPVDALKGIDLDIKKGELVALLGQNGSGKTTLALNLVGILRPTNEDAIIEVTGKNIKEIPLKETIQLINYVFQNPYNQLFCQTFGEEVEYGPKQLELPPEIIEQRVISALEDVGLLELRKFYQASLTRSEATLLGLASVLSMNPLVIIADEPTKGLDEPTGRKVLKVLQKRCDSGGAVLMITHDMELAARYATRRRTSKGIFKYGCSPTGFYCPTPNHAVSH
jgi:energy-coupling factor transporter ATP-binding protein EcfA2